VSFEDTNYEKYTAEEMMEEVASIIAACAHEYLFDSSGNFRNWEKFDVSDLRAHTETPWAMDLEELSEEVQDILAAFGVSFDEKEEEEEEEESIINVDVTHKAPDNVGGSTRGNLEKNRPGRPTHCEMNKCGGGSLGTHILEPLPARPIEHSLLCKCAECEAAHDARVEATLKKWTDEDGAQVATTTVETAPEARARSWATVRNKEPDDHQSGQGVRRCLNPPKNCGRWC
jgi:hypothetical protein